MKVYRYSPFNSDPFGHGGEKRAKQITELLEKLGIIWTPLTIKANIGKATFKSLIALFFNFRFIISLKLSIKSFKQYWYITRNIFFIQKLINSIEPQSLLIYEHSLNLNWFVPVVFKRLGHRIIAIPHNLESLVPEQKTKITNIKNPNGFLEEILVLKSAELVLTISREEEWLLNLYGINAVYYPYVPTLSEMKLLKNIFEIRRTRKSNFQILILGTAANPPSRLGMVALLSYLDFAETEDYIFHIAGFQTEKLTEGRVYSKKFIFHGTVNLSHLHELYQIVDAAIISQTPSTGALTRIPELLNAGLPVLANNQAARSFYNIKGLIIYRTFAELVSIIRNKELIRSSFSDYTSNDYEQVCREISTITNQ